MTVTIGICEEPADALDPAPVAKGSGSTPIPTALMAPIAGRGRLAKFSAPPS